MAKKYNATQHTGVLQAFSDVLRRMDITDEDVRIASRKLQLPKIDHALELKLKTTGLEVENGLRNENIEFCSPNSFIFYKRRPMMVYIKDQYHSMEQHEKGKFNPFHICYCEQLQENIRKNKLQRYVVTNNLSGEFIVNLKVKGYDGEIFFEEEGRTERLHVCQSCLRMLNWKNFNRYCNNTGIGVWYNGGDPAGRFNIVRRFSIKEFFAKVEDEYFAGKLNLYSAAASLDDAYRLTGKEKFELKESRGFKCEYCGQRKRPDALQIHHKDHNKGNNSPKNLAVICEYCHDHIHEIEGGFKQLH